MTTAAPAARPRAPRHVAVVGGAGFLGSHVCDEALRRGLAVTCVDDLSTGSLAHLSAASASSSFRFERADARGVARLDDIDAIVFVAGPSGLADFLTHPHDSLAVLGAGVVDALAFATAAHLEFVLVSAVPAPVRGSVDDPGNAFAAARAFAESATALHRSLLGTATTIVRVGYVYGPRERADLGRTVPAFVRQALEGGPIVLAGAPEEPRPVCFVDDVARGVVDAVERARRVSGPLLLSGSPVPTLAELAEAVARAVGGGIRIESRPFPVAHDARAEVAVGTAAELGWRPTTSLDEGLARTVAAALTAAAG